MRRTLTHSVASPALIVMLVLLVVGTAAADARADLSRPGPFQAGTKSVIVSRPNGSTFTATLHYPATRAGSNAPFDAASAPCACVTFGHGFLQPVSQYTSTLAHLATHGFITIASQSEGGLLPNHANLAKDLRFCLDWLEQQNASPQSELFGAIRTDAFGASGHSMGAGAAILAAKYDPRIKGLALLAAAQTSPSSIEAIASVSVPVRLVVGSEDTIVPPSGSARPMYSNAVGPRQLLTIQGGFHCGFTDAGFAFCDSGSITREQQLGITRRLLTEFMLVHLGVQPSIWPQVWGADLPSAQETTVERDPRLSVATAPASVSTAPGSASMTTVTVTNTGSAATAVAIEVQSAEGWLAQPVEHMVDALAPGASASVDVSVLPVLRARAIPLRVSARRELDGATRAITALAVSLEYPSADLNADGLIDGADLSLLLGAWGACDRLPCTADLDGDGAIDGADLAILLGQWP